MIQFPVIIMPSGDGTGPWGIGPRSGRGFGYCNGYPGPGFVNSGPGLGSGSRGRMGYGCGWSRGNRWQNYPNIYYPPYTIPAVVPPQSYIPTMPGFTNEEYVKALEAQKKYFEENLERLKQEIDRKSQELEKK